MQLIDSHCHPQFEGFDDPAKLLAEAAEVSVTKLIAVGTTLDDSEKAAGLAEAFDNIWASAGVHPHDAANFLADKSADNRLQEILNKSRVVAVGEIGLDFYKNYAAKNDQLAALRRQLDATAALGKPYI